MKINTKKLALLGMSCAAAMILSYVESFVSFGVPGLKIGLANIMTVFLLYSLGWRAAAAVSLVRVVLSSLLFGSVMSLWYSLAGAVLSLLVMAMLSHFDFFSPAGTSIAGALCHNAAQIGVAVLVMGTKEIAYYLPVLSVAAVISGVVIGILGGVLIKRSAKFTSRAL